MRTIAEMDRMSCIARTSSAKMEHSNVNQGIALLLTSVVTEIVIAVICLMKLDAHRNIQAAATVQKRDSNVTTIFVFSILTFVTELMIAEITVMKHRLFVPL